MELMDLLTRHGECTRRGGKLDRMVAMDREESAG